MSEQLHDFERWWILQPGFDHWIRHTAHVHETRFRLPDREGMARMKATTYVHEFLATRGADVPIVMMGGQRILVSTPDALVLLVSYVCERHPAQAPSMKRRMVSLFSSFREPPKWALEVEREVLVALDKVIDTIAPPSMSMKRD